MENKNPSMTALISLFVRAYHTKRSPAPVYADEYAERLMTKEEYETVARSMKNGAGFFFPGFGGTPDEVLDKVVNTRLAPAVVSRGAFCLAALRNAVMLGAKQLVVLGSGYDALPYKSEIYGRVRTFELDRREMLADKRSRLDKADIDRTQVTFVPCDLSKGFEKDLISVGYNKSERTFVCALGLCHYLEKKEFSLLLKRLSLLMPAHSEFVFDYPLETADGENTVTQKLAFGAGEKMKARYSYSELEKLAEKNGFLIYEHLSKAEIDEKFFAPHNAFTSGTGVMTAAEDFALCRAVLSR